MKINAKRRKSSIYHKFEPDDGTAAAAAGTTAGEEGNGNSTAMKKLDQQQQQGYGSFSEDEQHQQPHVEGNPFVKVRKYSIL